MSSTPLPSVLVIGAGMYVCGRGTPGMGTILPTLVQAQADGLIGDLSVAATSQESVRTLREKLAEINLRLETNVTVHIYPEHGNDSNAYRAALAELHRPACVVVAVPDHLHADIAAEVIEAGLPLLVVKPLTATVAEAHRLIDLAQTRQVYGAVDFHKRFDEANLLLRQTLADGRLGEVRHIAVEFSQRREIQKTFASWVQQTNVFQYLGVHYVDLIAFVTGARPVRVVATGQPRVSVREGLWRLDAIQAVVEWEGAPSGNAFGSTILTNWVEPDRSSAMSHQTIKVLGTRGRYDSDQTHRGVQLITEAGIEEVNPYFSQLYRAAHGKPVVEGYGPRSIRQFLTDVQDLVDGTRQVSDLIPTRPSFQQALISTAVVEAVNRSLTQGELWVEVDTKALMESERGTRRLGSGKAPRTKAAVAS